MSPARSSRSMAGTASPPSKAALARFLSEQSGAERVELGRFELLAGGAIRHNWVFEAELSGGRLAGRQALVLRSQAPTGIASSLGLLEEFAVFQAAFGAGVTAPEPLFAGSDPAVC